MNEQIDTDQIIDAAAEVPLADVPMTVASVAELTAWRWAPTTKLGDSFVYFRSSASLMVTRSRSMATSEIADSVMASYLSGRCVPVQRRCGQEWIYSVQATDNDPVQALAVAQPPTEAEEAVSAQGLDVRHFVTRICIWNCPTPR